MRVKHFDWSRCLLAAGTALVFVAGCNGAPQAVPTVSSRQGASNHVRYRLKLLKGLGGTSSSGDGINNRGWITGWSTLSGSMNPEHEILWIGNRKFDLGTLGGPSSAIEFSKKGNTNDVPGESETSTKDPLGEDFCLFGTGYTCLGTDWRNGDLDALPTLGGNNGIAIGNNDRGQIVGVAETNVTDPNCAAPQVLDFEATVWQPRTHRPRALPTLTGDTVGVATAINDRGDIVGGSGPTCATLTPALAVHPLLWKDGSPILLPTLGGTMNNVPWMINQHGEMAGMANVSGDATTHAVLWRNPKTVNDLGTLPGDFSSVADSMNDKEQLVGQSCDASGNCRGFIWQNGEMSDLNTLVSGGSRYYVVTANDINDDGIIVGEAYDTKSGATPAFEAIPAGDGAPLVRKVSAKVLLPASVRERLRRRLKPPVSTIPLGDHHLARTTKLYVIGGYGSTNAVNIFSAPGYKEIGSIKKGVSSPSSLWVDRNGDLYVANAQDVTEYAPGGHAPICSYKVTGTPSYVTTDNGDHVFATSRGKGSYHDNYQISYLDGFTQCGARFKHYEWDQPFFSYAAGVAADSSSNVFVSIYTGFEEFKGGASKPIHLRAHVNYVTPGALLIDKRNNLLSASKNIPNGNIYEITPPYKSATVLASPKGAGNLSLNGRQTLLYSGNGYKPLLTVYQYPSGKLFKTLKISTQSPAGLAISPDATF